MQDYAVIDIETRNALNFGETVPWQGEIIGVGVCTGRLIEDCNYYSGEDIEAIIKELSEKQTPLIAYNALFEVSWLNYHFEKYPLNWIADAALYAIALDNSAPSFSLKETAQKLVWYEDWGKVVEDYCVEHFKCARSKWGSYIPRLPYEMLAEYCMKDCHATYLIYERGLKMLDIKYINDFFMAEVMLTSEAYTIGNLVDRELAAKLLTEVTNTFEGSFSEFNNHPELKEHIENALKTIYEEGIKKRLEKSKTGKIKIPSFDEWKVKNPFNPGSSKQLTEVFKSQKLFYNEAEGRFIWPEMTKGGSPCLDADHLFMYGTGGQILAKAGEIKSKKNKLKMIMRDSEHESRAHFDINLTSVRSTRVSSNGLNIVATPLDNEIGECFVADEGWMYFLCDFCLHPKVEYLTKRGWIKILDLAENDFVWQVNPITLEGSWCKPLRIIKRHFKGKMYHYVTGNNRGSLSVTENHKMLWVGQQDHEREDKIKYRGFKLAQDFAGNPKGYHFAHFTNPMEDFLALKPEWEIWIACAIQADGSWLKKDLYTIQVNKPRKVEKLKEFLKTFGVEGKESKQRDCHNYSSWNFTFKFNSSLLIPGREKLFNLEDLSKNQARLFVEALCFWDGGFEDAKKYETGRFNYFSTQEKNIDEVQMWLVRNGYEARKRLTFEGNDKQKPCWALSIKEKGTSRFGIRLDNSMCEVIEEDFEGKVGCVTVDEGFILVRQEGQTFVTGNCALEPTVSAMLTKDKMLSYCSYFGEGKKPFWENGILNIDDTYLCYLSATKRWRDEISTMCMDEWMTNPEGLKKRFKVIRQAGKKLVLMTGYGSGIEKVCLSIHKELGIHIDKKEGRELINTLWAVFPEMFRYITWLKAQVAAGKTIHTWLGFPIAPSPEIAHCVFNYRVQTEAQHVMKHFLWQIHQRKEKWFVPAIVNIHDATCFQVHEDRAEDFKKILNDSLSDVNESLEEWTNGIKFRLSVHTGKTLREAKEG